MAKYIIGHGLFAQARLDLQHYIFMEELDGHILDPSIPFEKPGLLIGDLCAGTGAWTLQMSRRAPKGTKFMALDMNLSTQPDPGCLPSCVTSRQFNLFDPPEKDLVEVFDVINIQLVFMFVNDARIQPVLKNIMEMLKPGGYLQFSDYIAGAPVWSHSPDPSYEPKYVSELWPRMMKLLGVDVPSWPDNLDEHFGNAGFENVKAIRPQRVLSTFRSWTEMASMGYEDEVPSSFLMKAGDTAETRQQLEEYLEVGRGARKEVREKGVTAKVKTIRVVGSKPVS